MRFLNFDSNNYHFPLGFRHVTWLVRRREHDWYVLKKNLCQFMFRLVFQNGVVAAKEKPKSPKSQCTAFINARQVGGRGERLLGARQAEGVTGWMANLLRGLVSSMGSMR